MLLILIQGLSLPMMSSPILESRVCNNFLTAGYWTTIRWEWRRLNGYYNRIEYSDWCENKTISEYCVEPTDGRCLVLYAEYDYHWASTYCHLKHHFICRQ